MLCHPSLRITTGATESDVESEQTGEAEAATVMAPLSCTAVYRGRVPAGTTPTGHA